MLRDGQGMWSTDGADGPGRIEERAKALGELQKASSRLIKAWREVWPDLNFEVALHSGPAHDTVEIQTVETTDETGISGTNLSPPSNRLVSPDSRDTEGRHSRALGTDPKNDVPI